MAEGRVAESGEMDVSRVRWTVRQFGVMMGRRVMPWKYVVGVPTGGCVVAVMVAEELRLPLGDRVVEGSERVALVVDGMLEETVRMMYEKCDFWAVCGREGWKGVMEGYGVMGSRTMVGFETRVAMRFYWEGLK